MRTKSIALRLALALTLGNVALLLLTSPGGHEPEVKAASESQRRSLCEMVAISSSILASREDWTNLERNLKEIAARHSEVRSAAVRGPDGKLVAEVGQRTAAEQGSTNADARSFPVRVPILAGEQRWGTVELQLVNGDCRAAHSWWQASLPWRISCVAIASGAMLYLVFGAVLRRLDPTDTRRQLAATRAELDQTREELRRVRESAAPAPASPAEHSPWLPPLDDLQSPVVGAPCQLT